MYWLSTTFGSVTATETFTEWHLLKGTVAGYLRCQVLLSYAATLGSVKPHSVGTPRPYEALHYRGSLHRSKPQGMNMKEQSGM